MRFAAVAESSALPAAPRGNVLFYTGPSMNPLLRENDLLELTPCGSAGAGPGDVIAFEDSASGLIVVHRVVAIGARGLITRGDNNVSLDTAPVRDDQVIGRVSAAWRGARKIDVAGGSRGRLVVCFLRLRRSCRRRSVRQLPVLSRAE